MKLKVCGSEGFGLADCCRAIKIEVENQSAKISAKLAKVEDEASGKKIRVMKGSTILS